MAPGFVLSPSTLKILRECPRCFWLQFREGVKRPAGIFPSLPSGMDRVLKEHFDSFRDRGEMPPELSELRGYKLFDDVPLLEVWRNWRKGISWTDREGNRLYGAVDNILQKGDKLVVLDYKTRGFPLKEDTASYYQDQMDIYTFLLQKNGYKTEDYAFLLFYHPARVLKSGEVVFHTDLVKRKVDVKNAEKLFQKALRILAGGKPRASTECGYCAWGKQYV
jgi:hypothetical protein